MIALKKKKVPVNSLNRDAIKLCIPKFKEPPPPVYYNSDLIDESKNTYKNLFISQSDLRDSSPNRQGINFSPVTSFK